MGFVQIVEGREEKTAHCVVTSFPSPPATFPARFPGSKSVLEPLGAFPGVMSWGGCPGILDTRIFRGLCPKSSVIDGWDSSRSLVTLVCRVLLTGCLGAR